MKEITLRQFQQKASKHLKDMPLVLTRYGKAIATVVPYEEEVESLEHEILKKETVDTPSPVEPREKEVDIDATAEEIIEDTKQAIEKSEQIEHNQEDEFGLSVFQKEFRECQEHYDPGVNHECYLTSFTNVDGIRMWTRWICSGCFKSLYEKVSMYGGHLAPPENK